MDVRVKLEPTNDGGSEGDGSPTSPEIKELNGKLAGYRFSLGRLETALSKDPANEDLITLHKDLVEVIQAAEKELTDLHDKMIPKGVSVKREPAEPASTSRKIGTAAGGGGPGPSSSSQVKTENDNGSGGQFNDEEMDSDDDEEDEDYVPGAEAAFTSPIPGARANQLSRSERKAISHRFVCAYCSITPRRFLDEFKLNRHIKRQHPSVLKGPEFAAKALAAAASGTGRPEVPPRRFFNDKARKSFKRKEKKVAKGILNGTVCTYCPPSSNPRALPKVFMNQQCLSAHIQAKHPHMAHNNN